jgi:hypothetical protein
MPTLADIYSTIDSAKRRGADVIRNPGASLQQMIGYGVDRANAARDQLYQATEEEGIGYGPKTQQLAKQMAEVYNPIGMTAIKGFPQDYHQFGGLLNQASMDLKANPNKETYDRFRALMEARDNAPINNPKNVKAAVVEEAPSSYQGQHEAPTMGSGKPLHDLSDVYPQDFYSFEAPRLYGHGMDEARDARIIRQLQSFKGRPDRPVTIYRAVPKDVPRGAKINQGDWVTTDRQYAIEHGMGALNGEYKIIKQNVKARDLFTNGDSIYEMGYDPQPYTPRSQR